MSGNGNEVAYITQFVRRLRGGSEPVLVRASDGLLYVVKYRNNLQGPNVLFNESAGTELYRAYGLLTPDWKPLDLTESFLDRNPDAWMPSDYGPIRPEAGLCIGFQYLRVMPGKTQEAISCAEAPRVANRMSFWLAWLIDVCAHHVDNRQAIFKEDFDGYITAYFIDHGHMFGGPDGRHRLPLCASHYIDPRIYPDLGRRDLHRLLTALNCVKPRHLWKCLHGIPDEWKTATALQGFGQCLQELSDTLQLRMVVEELAMWLERSTGREFALSRHVRDSLHPSLQRNAFGRIQFAG